VREVGCEDAAGLRGQELLPSAGTAPRATAGRPAGSGPGDLSAQHRVLMTQHQQLGVLGHLTSAPHHQASEQAANKHVDDREDHEAMISNLVAR